MSLLYNMMSECVFLIPTRTKDGSGGNRVEWAEGEHFNAAIIRNTSTEVLKAESATTDCEYSVTVPRSVHLKYHAVIKRISDGKIFRITSDNTDAKTPLCATLDMAQSTAEAWRLTA